MAALKTSLLRPCGDGAGLTQAVTVLKLRAWPQGSLQVGDGGLRPPSIQIRHIQERGKLAEKDWERFLTKPADGTHEWKMQRNLLEYAVKGSSAFNCTAPRTPKAGRCKKGPMHKVRFRKAK